MGDEVGFCVFRSGVWVWGIVGVGWVWVRGVRTRVAWVFCVFRRGLRGLGVVGVGWVCVWGVRARVAWVFFCV